MTEPAKPLAERLLALEAAVAELAGRLDELAGPVPGDTVGAGVPDRPSHPDGPARPEAAAKPAARGKS